MNFRIFAVTVLVALSTTMFVRAEFVNLEAQWSGADFGNGASATATFTLDLSMINNPGFTMLSTPWTAVQNFQLTVAGASAGNGAFSSSDFSALFLNTAGGTLDFNTQLVGQSTTSGLWGYGGFGDLNFFSSGSNPLAPTGASQFTLRTGGSELMRLTSLAPAAPSAPVAVPETSTWVMGILAVGFVAVSLLRSRAARQALSC